MPPLRERQEEIVPLAKLFVAQAREQWGASAVQLSDEVMAALSAYPWPGNVRQLRNVIERAVTICAHEIVGLDDLPEELRAESGELSPLGAHVGGELSPLRESGQQRIRSFRPLPVRVREFEIAIIREALVLAQGNQAQAARILGVPRRTLASKLQVYAADLSVATDAGSSLLRVASKP